MTTEHAWVALASGVRGCSKCTVKTHDGHWQRKKGAQWRSVGREPIPTCTGAEGSMPTDTKALLLKAWLALDDLPSALKQATEAEATMHNIKSLLAEHGVKVPR